MKSQYKSEFAPKYLYEQQMFREYTLAKCRWQYWMSLRKKN